MKKQIFTLLIVLLFVKVASAQTFSYQGIARNNTGSVLKKNLKIRLTMGKIKIY